MSSYYAPFQPPHSSAGAATAVTAATAATPEQQLRLLVDNLPALIAYFLSDGMKCLFANEAYAAAYGFTVASIVGKSVREVIGAEAYTEIHPFILRVLDGENVSYERLLELPDGSIKTIEVNLIPQFVEFVEGSKPTAAFVLINDISKYRLAEQSIRDSEERLRKFAEATNEGIVFFENGIITDANEALAQLARLPVAELIGRPNLDFVAPDSRETVIHNVRTGFEKAYEATLLRADGTIVAVEFVGKVIVRGGKTLRMTIVRDISDRKQAEARIQFLAHHDILTSLPNRAMLMDRLQIMLNVAKRQGTQVGVLFIDLDNFKSINDSLGHYAGDQLLKRLAQRLQGCVRNVDLIGRLGGDEFLVILTGIERAEDITPVAQKIVAAIGDSFVMDGQTLSVTGSVGISVFPKDGEDTDTLVRNADSAMYLAKEHGRNNFQFFIPSLSHSSVASRSLESGMRRAIQNVEFVLYYQPEVLSKTGKINSVEALIRWQHPELGLLGPDKFISIAEHRGLIMPIGRWVINEAIRQCKAWLDVGIRVPVAVNISAVQFKQKDLVEVIAQNLRDHGLPGELLELELTESLFLEDVATMTITLGELKKLGVTLAVDDFGTGYSSLAYLKRYPIDKIKIDRSFLSGVPHDPEDVAITAAIINLAENLGLTVVAEGVETVEQATFLERYRCDYIQGYLISRPLPPDQILDWMRQRPN